MSRRLWLCALALMACGTADTGDTSDSAEVCTIVTWEDYMAQEFPYMCARWELCEPDWWHYDSVDECVEEQTEHQRYSEDVFLLDGCGPFDPEKGCTQLACAKAAVDDCGDSCTVRLNYLMEPTCDL